MVFSPIYRSVSCFELPRAKKLPAALLLVAMAAVVAPSSSHAGPPLLCPPTVLGEAEQAELALIADQSASLEDAIKELLKKLQKSNSPRFHIESVRYFYHLRGHDALEPLITALAALTKAQKTQKDLLTFDLNLARMMFGYSSAKCVEWACELARVANRHEDPALWLTTAQAIDLARGRSSSSAGYLLSSLSQQYFERALEHAQKDQTPNGKIHRKMVLDLAPFMKGMNPRDWNWEKLDKQLEALKR